MVIKTFSCLSIFLSIFLLLSCNKTSDQNIYEKTKILFISNKKLFIEAKNSFVEQNNIRSILKTSNEEFPLKIFKLFFNFSTRYKISLIDESEYFIEVPKGFENEKEFWNEKVKVTNKDTMDLITFLNITEVKYNNFLEWINLLNSTQIISIIKDNNFIKFISNKDYVISYNYTDFDLKESITHKNFVKRIDSLWYFMDYH